MTALALNIITPFDIETFDGLSAYIIAHLELDSESQTQVPTFIRQAEYRLDRLVVAPNREYTANVTTTAAEQTVALPVDYRHLRNVRLVADAGHSLEQVTLSDLHTSYTDSTGEPIVFAYADEALQLGPIPDAAYTLELTYSARIPPLSAANQTNWLLSQNADAYVYSTLMAASVWLEDLDAAATYRAELMSIIDELNLQGNRRRHAGPTRLRSPVVV